jgi:hypothetical protein
VFGDRVYFVSRGFRHWIRDASWFTHNGASWPESVNDVEPRVLLSFLPGGAAPLAWTAEHLAAPPPGAGSFDLREIALSPLRGHGIEVGAGSSPSPLPLACRVLYADRLRHSELEVELYPGQLREDLVDPDIESDLETLSGIADESLDFVVACHVIEHTRNPIGAIANAWRKLRPGGHLALVIPDMERTFDRARQVTPLAHLIDDFRDPQRERDRAHYEEFYRLAFNVPAASLSATVEEKFRTEYAIHYHAWTFDSFAGMIDWTRSNAAPYRAVWSHPAGVDPAADIEFYFVLTK